MQDSYRVLGFIARGEVFPNFLMTLLQKDLELFLLFPSGDLVRSVKDDSRIPATEADWLERPSYTQDKRGIVSQELAELRSFGFSKDDIIMGSIGYLTDEIAKRSAAPGISSEDADMFREIHSRALNHKPTLQLAM